MSRECEMLLAKTRQNLCIVEKITDSLKTELNFCETQRKMENAILLKLRYQAEYSLYIALDSILPICLIELCQSFLLQDYCAICHSSFVYMCLRDTKQITFKLFGATEHSMLFFPNFTDPRGLRFCDPRNMEFWNYVLEFVQHLDYVAPKKYNVSMSVGRPSMAMLKKKLYESSIAHANLPLTTHIMLSVEEDACCVRASFCYEFQITNSYLKAARFVWQKWEKDKV